MPNIDELTPEELRAHLQAIAAGTTDLSSDMREKLIARALSLVMERLSGPLLKAEDLAATCPSCHGTRQITKDLGHGSRTSTTCSCQRGFALTELGQAIANIAWRSL